eukprot:scaffold278011_cov36-Tisochrysis_lutea.AAC.2
MEPATAALTVAAATSMAARATEGVSNETALEVKDERWVEPSDDGLPPPPPGDDVSASIGRRRWRLSRRVSTTAPRQSPSPVGDEGRVGGGAPPRRVVVPRPLTILLLTLGCEGRGAEAAHRRD